MKKLRFPAPESTETATGAIVHQWKADNEDAAVVGFIHGFASNTLFNWVKTGWLDSLSSAGFTILSVDLPGHGVAKHTNPRALTPADIYEDLSRTFRETVGGSAFSLHGYSLGARIAWELALAEPHLIDGLILGGVPRPDRLSSFDSQAARQWASQHSLGLPEPVIEEPTTASLLQLARSIPDQEMVHVVELLNVFAGENSHTPSGLPGQPTVIAYGTRDDVARPSEELQALFAAETRPPTFVPLPGRNHVNALTARPYKDAVLDFLHSDTDSEV